MQNLGWGFSGSIPGMGSAGFGNNGMGVNTPFGGFSGHWNQMQNLGYIDQNGQYIGNPMLDGRIALGQTLGL